MKYSQNPAAIAMRRLRANNPGFRQRDMVRCRDYRNRKLAENPRYEADRKAAWRLRKRTESHAAKFKNLKTTKTILSAAIVLDRNSQV